MTPLNKLIQTSHVIRGSTVQVGKVDSTLLRNIQRRL